MATAWALTTYRLKSVCTTAKTSVPRNRVYSKYAERCGTERVIPLNPASFGKLVRVIFPGIQTRRLGVRGESKYHYVDLALMNDTDDGDDIRRPATANTGMDRQSLTRQNSMAPTLDFKYVPLFCDFQYMRLTRSSSMPRIAADTASFPPQDQAFESNNSYSTQETSKALRFTNIYSASFRPATHQPTSSSYEAELRFPTQDQLNAKDDLDMSLPDITPYLPARTDPDLAGALVALYRTHCTSLIDSVRYCKEKQFFRLFTSFHGTLTLPVQRLFAQSEIAPWIKECDWLMYQKMIRNVSQLTLQVAPPPVLKFLDNVAKQLHIHLSKVFNALPLHVLEAKLEPATLFAHLLRQMLRVNSTAHAAAAMLLPDENRDKMWSDWKGYVCLKRIIENELPPSCGHEQVFNIMSTEIRGLLTPLKPEIWLPDGTLYRENTPDASDASNETVIDRIAAFLTNLPSRFPHVPARTMLQCINSLGAAALREITVENGMSFQGWWLTKVFIDEMGQWLASLGGFLSHSPPSWNTVGYSPGMMNEPMNAGMANGSGSNNESRYSSMDADFGQTQSFITNNNNSGSEY
jgi:regulatory factor X